VEREEVIEFHYLTPIANVNSILQRGILSHQAVAAQKHVDISMANIQARRASKNVPGGRALHEYVNLYFNGRNKMMAKRRNEHANICVLRIAERVLDLPGAIIADQNASSSYVCFLPSPAGLKKLNYDEVFARSWIFPNNQIQQWKIGSRVCAELLIPNHLPSEHILGAYVLNEQVRDRLISINEDIDCEINTDIFLR